MKNTPNKSKSRLFETKTVKINNDCLPHFFFPSPACNSISAKTQCVFTPTAFQSSLQCSVSGPLRQIHKVRKQKHFKVTRCALGRYTKCRILPLFRRRDFLFHFTATLNAVKRAFFSKKSLHFQQHSQPIHNRNGNHCYGKRKNLCTFAPLY